MKKDILTKLTEMIEQCGDLPEKIKEKALKELSWMRRDVFYRARVNAGEFSYGEEANETFSALLSGAFQWADTEAGKEFWKDLAQQVDNGRMDKNRQANAS